MSTSTDVPVLVAGGGPVGITLAMDLARFGVRSIVLEHRREIPPNPRCNTTNARSMELLRRLGCADAVRDAGLPADHNTDIVYMTHFGGRELTRYHRSTTAEVRAGRQHDVAANWPTPEPQHFLSQLYLEPVLRRHAVDHFGLDLREGLAFVSFTQDDGGVTSVARDVDSGEEHIFRSQYLMGADGSNSIIRAAIGARLEGIPRLGDTCSTFFRSRRLAELSRATPGWMFRFIGGGVLVAIDGDERWLLHNGVPAGEHRDTFDPEPAMFQAIGEPFDYEILGRARWTPRAMVANKFRERRVFLGGDAAHLWIPLGGFGMNAGIVDAISLSWRLAGVLQGWLDDKVLDSYEVERAPLGNRVAMQAAKWSLDLRPLMEHTVERLALLEGDDGARHELGDRIRATNLGEFECPGFQLGYYYADSPVICHDPDEAPPATTLETYVETSWPGVRAPHIWRANGESLFDQFGLGFTLLRIGAQPPTGDALIDAARERGVPLTVVDVAEASAVDKYQGYGLVLVRPDQHVVWRANAEPTPDAARHVLDRVTGVLVPERVVVDHRAERIADGFLFGEGLRWIDERLVFSDMIGRLVIAHDPATGVSTTRHQIDDQPNGLGLLPDGRLVVASMFDKVLLVEGADGLELYEDLSDVVTGYLGDVVVDQQGRVFVGDTGVRVLHGEPLEARTGRLIRVDGPGHHEVVLDDLAFPNGLVVSPDGHMLYIAQSGRRVVVQCRIASDGSLSTPRPFVAQLADGMTGDRAGGVWVCDPRHHEVARYDSAGRTTARVIIDGGQPIACALDAAEEHLYIVGIEDLPAGVSLFEAMAAAQTRSILWSATLGDDYKPE